MEKRRPHTVTQQLYFLPDLWGFGCFPDVHGMKESRSTFLEIYLTQDYEDVYSFVGFLFIFHSFVDFDGSIGNDIVWLLFVSGCSLWVSIFDVTLFPKVLS